MSAELIENRLNVRANLIINQMQRGGELSYDEAIELGEMSSNILENTPPSDVAYPVLSRDMLGMFSLAWALNRVHKLGRKEHLQEVKIIASYDGGNITEEASVFINKGVHNKIAVEREASAEYYRTAVLNGVPTPKLADLQVVLL